LQTSTLPPSVDATVPGVTQFVGSIELQPLQSGDSAGSPVATNTDGAGGGGYQTCERPDSGPEYNAIHKAPSEIQDQAFLDKLKLGDPRGNVPYPTIQYMSLDITLPTFVDLWDPTIPDTNCSNKRLDAAGNQLYDVPADVADIYGEGFYAFPGFWLPNFTKSNGELQYSTKFEGGVAFNCDQQRYSLFTEPLRLATRVLEPGNTARWGTPGQKVRLEQYFETGINSDGYTYITKMTYKVSSTSVLSDGKNNFTFSFEPDPQAAVIGKAQDVQDIVWANSFGLAQGHNTTNPDTGDGKHPPVESGSVVQGLEFSNVKIAGCPTCTAFAWEEANLRGPKGCTTEYTTITNNGGVIGLDFAACTNKITSGEDAGQCDSDLDGIADYKERADKTNPFDSNDPGQGQPHIYVSDLDDQSTSNTEYLETNVGEKTTGSFKIGNDGNAELTYSLVENADWLTFTSTNGLLTPDIDTTLEYDVICPATPGLYSETVTINNNDPTNPALPITLALTCVKPQPPVDCMELEDIDTNAIEQSNATEGLKLAIGPHLKIDTDKPQCGNWVSTGWSYPYRGYFEKEIELVRKGEVTESYYKHKYSAGGSVEEQWYRKLPAVDYISVGGLYLPGSALGNTVESDISDILIPNNALNASSYELIESYTLSEEEGDQYNWKSHVLLGKMLKGGLEVIEGETGEFKAVPSISSRNYCFIRCFNTSKVYEGPNGFLEIIEPLPWDSYTEEQVPANGVTVINMSGVEIKRFDETVLGHLAQGTELWLIHFNDVVYPTFNWTWYPLFKSADELKSWIANGNFEILFSTNP
jgi:hypothetical protein